MSNSRSRSWDKVSRSGRVLFSTPDSTGSVTPSSSHWSSQIAKFSKLFDEADGSSNALIPTPYIGIDLVSAQLFRSGADTAHHLLLHHKMRQVEGCMAYGTATSANQQPRPSAVIAELKAPRPG